MCPKCPQMFTKCPSVMAKRCWEYSLGNIHCGNIALFINIIISIRIISTIWIICTANMTKKSLDTTAIALLLNLFSVREKFACVKHKFWHSAPWLSKHERFKDSTKNSTRWVFWCREEESFCQADRFHWIPESSLPVTWTNFLLLRVFNGLESEHEQISQLLANL